MREFSHECVAPAPVYDRAIMRLSRGPLSSLAGLLLAACGDDGVGSGSNSAASTGAETGTSAQPTTATTTASAGTASAGDEPTAGSATGTATATTSGPTSAPSEPTTNGPATTGGVDPDTGTTASSSDGGDTTTGEVAKGTVRFVAFGDTGEGNEAQYAVAQAIVALCAEKSCDFGIMLGDNFYDSGVDGVDDPQWQDKFELPYEDITFPLYPTLGNHDYGGNGIGVDFDTQKSKYQVDYTKLSQIWRLPAKYHSFKQDHAEFWDLDTNQIMTDPINGDSGAQQAWFDQGVSSSNAAWKIVFGHHPYISNGDHGNAGSYDNLEAIPFPFVTGERVKDFVEASICGKVDMYISGHDHNLQWLEPKCDTEFILSGAGSKAEPLPGVNPAYFGAPETEGFLWVEIKDDSLTGIFYDATGKELYAKTITK